ncbi:DUF4468 domain-containing protein [Marinobacter alexandrii]|uniref:DUF4468 domain-containing protein n=1 Tax=Marinobacter alexandrii TaxID=2570351 RepID=UPI001FFF14EA|nr:DUF4468 domain-containing protein [Marinobacter alexandrii]MCK2149486.1 DUF4468 domain-containing protein [Marinobacter alexandrii]
MTIRKSAFIVAISAGLSACGTMVNAPQSDLQYQAVHEVQLSKSEIFNQTQEWFATAFADSKEVIEVANPDTGVIIGKGQTRISPTGLVSVPVRMTIKVEAKPNRYRTTYSNYTGYYGKYQNNPHPLADAASVGQVRDQIKILDARLLDYLQRDDPESDDW